MTNRDPNNPEFIRKVTEFYDCYKNYLSFSSKEKLLEDKKVKDPYILPDGSVLELTNEKTRAPEILFSPEKIGLEYMGNKNTITFKKQNIKY